MPTAAHVTQPPTSAGRVIFITKNNACTSVHVVLYTLGQQGALSRARARARRSPPRRSTHAHLKRCQAIALPIGAALVNGEGKTTYRASLKGRRVVGARQMCPALLSAGDVHLPSAVRENDVQGVLERAPRRWSAPNASREAPRGPGGDQPRHARAAFRSGYGVRGQISDLLSGVYRTRVIPHTRCLTQGAYLIARRYSGVRAFTQHGIADLDD